MKKTSEDLIAKKEVHILVTEMLETVLGCLDEEKHEAFLIYIEHYCAEIGLDLSDLIVQTMQKKEY